MTNKQSRADRALIVIALLILLFAGSAFYFDDWMWGGRNRSADEKIGVMVSKSGDVRMKFKDDLKWQKAAGGQDLVYNDSIYSGQGAEAKLKLGESEMTVSENTLVVLRRQNDVNFLNLDYGVLFSKVAKNEKVVIDDGSGKTIELSTNEKAQIVLRKTTTGKTEVSVIAGKAEVKIDGEIQKIDENTRIVVDQKTKTAKIEKLKLRALKPLAHETVYSVRPASIPFAWAWSDGHPAKPGENYSLEFSATPDFEKIHARKDVAGQLGSSMTVSQSLSLYYRIRGPEGELSPTEKVNFVRMQPALIVQPLAQEKFIAPPGEKLPVRVELRKPAGASANYQIAADPEFQQIVTDQTVMENGGTHALEAGDYFVRARADYGQDRMSDWSPAVPFTVERELENLALKDMPAKRKVLIPNRQYPRDLYGGDDSRARAHLAKRGFMKNFFPLEEGRFDEIKIDVRGQKAFTQNHVGWPEALRQPGAYDFQYQTRKTGHHPSEVSSPKHLEIALEPPRAVGEPTFSLPDKSGQVEAKWEFTPLLFADTYDVEMSRDESFANAQYWRTKNTNVKTRMAPEEQWWRARARDKKGRIISDYSEPRKLTPPAPVATPEQNLAQEGLVERKPSAVEKTTTRIEQTPAEHYEKNGWWAWLGAGMNFTDYRQSGDSRYTLNTQNVKGPSQFFETGYIGTNGWGGLITYKNTPGELVFENATVDVASYSWSTLSVEGTMRRRAPISFMSKPVIYGLRVGIQRHSTPFLFLNSDAELQQKTNEMTTGSMGILAEWGRRRWTYYWLARYQLPLSTTSEGSSQFEIKPTFAFDGSIGASYNFTDRFKGGLFWYGQWHQYNFVYSDGLVTNEGFQSLFYSNIDLRVGVDF
ncbi:MAG TPA: hypothetical protein PKC28_03275 [Bdellovibrionales bacterium]|nr:hypothetical protein [Bdellovibrionales bacterium]